jgi:P-type E1-E2 ATPase
VIVSSAITRITEVTGAAPVLLTGDNWRAARRLASEVGISDVRARLLPPDKVDAVNDLQARGAWILPVGDGINDAPALAAAVTGAAMGRGGSDLALAGYRRRRDHARRPRHDPRRHHPLPAAPAR